MGPNVSLNSSNTDFGGQTSLLVFLAQAELNSDFKLSGRDKAGRKVTSLLSKLKTSSLDMGHTSTGKQSPTNTFLLVHISCFSNNQCKHSGKMLGNNAGVAS